MKKLTDILVEKFTINKKTEIVKSEEKKEEKKKNLASQDATIEVDLTKQFQFMLYDPNSGLVSCFDCDDWKDLVNKWAYEDNEAKRICNLNVGDSYVDVSGAIYTMIN